MEKRVFVAINLPDEALDAIEHSLQKFEARMSSELRECFRFIPKESWHVTLSFLGGQGEAAIMNVVTALKETASLFQSTPISFKKVCFGPPDRAPRMVWLTVGAQESALLAHVKDSLEDRLEASGIPFRREHRNFVGHITLARGSARERLRDRLEESVGITFTPRSLDLMESELRRTGAEYHLLQSAPFAS